MMLCRCKVAAEKEGFWQFGVTSLERKRITGFPGTAGAAGVLEKMQNGKANCCTLLKRITKLKCVNSEVKSVRH